MHLTAMKKRILRILAKKRAAGWCERGKLKEAGDLWLWSRCVR